MKELGIEHQVTIDGKAHPIKFGKEIQPTKGFFIKTYSFEDELGQEADGCLFVIEPGFSTRVGKITDPDFKVNQIAISGLGWLLALNPQGEVTVTFVGENEENPIIEMGEGWAYCWIASNFGDGLRVLSINQPPFDLDVEMIIEYEDARLPPEFWSHYCELKGQ